MAQITPPYLQAAGLQRNTTGGQLHNLLWTGGLDSTYRLAELAFRDVIVQPYYVIDPNGRKSQCKEQRAMESILAMLRSNPNVKAQINDIKYINGQDIPENVEITKSWEKMRILYKLGSQYDWLARFAFWKDMDLELGILTDFAGSKIGRALNGECKMIGKREDLRIDVTQSSNDGINIFRHMRFPLIGLTKKQELNKLIEMGLIDVAKTTWFCHDPVLWMPCGQCNPCTDALNEGMAWRVPKLGRILGSVRKAYRLCLEYFKRPIRWLLKSI